MNLADHYDLWKRIVTERVTSDRMVYNSACFLVGVHIELTNGQAVFDAHIYNGLNAYAEEKLTFVGQYCRAEYTPSLPMYFDMGLYVHRETNVTSITVQYIPMKAGR